VIDRFVYTAMTGAKHASGQLATTTHNLANSQTMGFREMLTGYRTVPIHGAAADSRAFVVDSTMGFNAMHGALQNTGNPLDVALNQDGFFAVQVEGGGEAYTRQGHMQVDANGYLVSQNGQKLLSTQDAPIELGTGYKSAYISADGGVYVQGSDGQHNQISQLHTSTHPTSEHKQDHPTHLRSGPRPLRRTRGGH